MDVLDRSEAKKILTMVIVRSPLRISIAGGGTDIPSWYKIHGSMFISAAIDKYIYTTLHRSKYNPNIRLRYSKMEEVATVDEIQHEIFRETLRGHLVGPAEITSHAEIPSGTGLGSSGAFGVGVLQALNPTWRAPQLAERATSIQIETLKYPIGKQDQYVSAFGGVRVYEVDSDGEVNTRTFMENPQGLAERLVMFYTGIKRDTNDVLKASTADGLEKIQEIAHKSLKALGTGDFDEYGRLLNEHWEFKKQRGGMTTPEIDKWYGFGKRLGALGGKLIGAGGGGFLLFYTHDPDKLIHGMPLMHQPFKFDLEGSKVIYHD